MKSFSVGLTMHIPTLFIKRYTYKSHFSGLAGLRVNNQHTLVGPICVHVTHVQLQAQFKVVGSKRENSRTMSLISSINWHHCLSENFTGSL